MKTDGVTFVDSVVKEMTKEEFIEAHINVVWLNLKEEKRRKKLSDVFDTITKKLMGWGVVTARPISLSIIWQISIKFMT